MAKEGLTKLYLNSFWDKLTESNNSSKKKTIADPQKQFPFLATPCFEVANLLLARDEVVWVKWKNVEEENMPFLRHTNKVVGSYVATAASLKLYSYPDMLRRGSYNVIKIPSSKHKSARSLWPLRAEIGRAT